jgi:hypothetical protein
MFCFVQGWLWGINLFITFGKNLESSCVKIMMYESLRETWNQLVELRNDRRREYIAFKYFIEQGLK